MIPAGAGQILNICTIDLVVATGGTTGVIDWVIEWYPLEPGAKLV